MKNRAKVVSALLAEEYDDGFKDGVSLGLQIAQRIAVWYQVNHTLIHPVSETLLKEWSDKALEELRAKLK